MTKKVVSWEKRAGGNIRLLSHGVIMECLEKETFEHEYFGFYIKQMVYFEE